MPLNNASTTAAMSNKITPIAKKTNAKKINFFYPFLHSRQNSAIVIIA